MAVRGQFSSRLGFILAAAGSAVGLGNIWGFPTQVASNGGAAFVLVYLLLTFLVAYPVLMAELIIGRHSQSNMVDALKKISPSYIAKKIGVGTGYWALLVVSLILSFYMIVAGWMIAYMFQAITEILGFSTLSSWLTDFSLSRNIVFSLLFAFMTVLIVSRGVSSGIEKWSGRLMPMLLVLIILLIGYVSMQDGAAEGWKAYLVPDFSKILNGNLILSAMGQAFFSLSLGVGSMLIYGSYVSKKENLVGLGASVALVDVGIAILSGMLIIPAMYVALNSGVTIFDKSGELIGGDQLIFTVIPSLFDTMGRLGNFISFIFFLLMTIAALTSSISMLEVPVAYTIENTKLERKGASWAIGLLVMLISLVLIFNFGALFSLVIDITTKYSQPLLGLMLCIFSGWVWKRNSILEEIKQGADGIENSLFWKIWPVYIRFICPFIIIAMAYHTIFIA